jgi:predicted RNA-binding protein (virulence factor B family)
LASKQARLSKAEIRRSINLSFLKKNAEEGNALSKKIWEQLEYYNVSNMQPKQSKFAA